MQSNKDQRRRQRRSQVKRLELEKGILWVPICRMQDQLDVYEFPLLSAESRGEQRPSSNRLTLTLIQAIGRAIAKSTFGNAILETHPISQMNCDYAAQKTGAFVGDRHCRFIGYINNDSDSRWPIESSTFTSISRQAERKEQRPDYSLRYCANDSYDSRQSRFGPIGIHLCIPKFWRNHSAPSSNSQFVDHKTKSFYTSNETSQMQLLQNLRDIHSLPPLLRSITGASQTLHPLYSQAIQTTHGLSLSEYVRAVRLPASLNPTRVIRSRVIFRCKKAQNPNIICASIVGYHISKDSKSFETFHREGIFSADRRRHTIGNVSRTKSNSAIVPEVWTHWVENRVMIFHSQSQISLWGTIWITYCGYLKPRKGWAIRSRMENKESVFESINRGPQIFARNIIECNQLSRGASWRFVNLNYRLVAQRAANI
jgi:hypothetical protein